MNLSRLLLLCLLLCRQPGTAQTNGFEYGPEQYVCYQAAGHLKIDGLIEEAEWGQAPWTKPFVDIEGGKKPLPYYETRAKMLWDDDYLYIAAELEEEHLWATYDRRDAVIFQENNFEVFLDPDGDTHNYYELEINALGTVWDLLLSKPYRDGGPAINGWDISGLKKGIQLSGTLNKPSDTDRGWSVELAIPWKTITRQRPKDGEIWRVNFSRVEWKIENAGGAYRKSIDPATGKAFPEYNWVWSPQGVVAMHRPETWGFVQFTETRAGDGEAAFRGNPDDEIKWLLRQLYYAEHQHKREKEGYTQDLSALGLPEDIAGRPGLKLWATEHVFVAWIEKEHYTWHIREDGRTWKEKNL